MIPVADSSVAAARGQLQRLLRRHRWRSIVTVLLVALGMLLALLGAYHRWPGAAPLLLGIGTAGLLLLAAALWPLRRLDAPALARRLDLAFPNLEDSTGLLLADAPTGLLGPLQQERVARRLPELPLHNALPAPWRGRLVLAAAAALLGLLLWRWPLPVLAPAPALQPRFAGPPPSSSPVPPTPVRLLSTRIRLAPPAYTRQPASDAPQLSFRCAQGTLVRWTLRLSRPDAPPRLLVAGRPPVRFRAVAGRPAEFVAEYRFTRSALYRLQLAGQASDDYAVDVQPDAPPTLRLLAPRPYTLIAATEPPTVAVRVALRDDYGLRRARLVVTTAQGEGEAVKFRETVTDLSAALGAQPRQHTATATLRLPALGLTFGDELYVYAEAWDALGQRSRTEAALVQWQDTARTDAVAAISLGVNQMPAYFRSQRQIIIDTEKLLRQQRQLPPAEFRSRANNLGDDQKILRLRYGKFLGEEGSHGLAEAAPRPPVADEDEEPAHSADDGHDHGHDHAAPPTSEGGAPTADELMAPYQHLHDDAETADFLEPQVKAKLRAVLSQMWDAELRLRLAQPADALPYEYRALRLLKEVQQQTRAYVRKSGVDLPPLPEAEKRLTGDLSAAVAPRRQGQRPAPAATQPAVRRALTLLQAYRAGQRPAAADLPRLRPAGQVLGTAALQQPGAALPALRAWRRLLAQVQAGQPVAPADAAAVERAFGQLLPLPAATPQRPTATPLARRYFQELSR
ncbi:hypothetical protein EJV47_03190 [Hymenobacter gummosus]|uniref:DUF4175 family protein n=1 Tax=Hymenobacter gummosus TaxID=1776032 RepID=A0A431U942_9BACT|nr:hypothetical protein [Hymenobacter gummosus]RTQ53753.1 hypothetical protein EJV47_03190 [Hymenobacter gummosus]